MAINFPDIRKSLKRDDGNSNQRTTPKRGDSQSKAADSQMPHMVDRYRSALKKGIKEITVGFGDVSITYRRFEEFLADIYSEDFPREVELINEAVKAGLAQEEYDIILVYKSTENDDYTTDAAQAAAKFRRHFTPWAAFVDADGSIISLCDEATTEDFLEKYDANATGQ